jgi:ABC-type transport system involved in cytochrome bd biosynthesis fused ATPase/permease subunit
MLVALSDLLKRELVSVPGLRSVFALIFVATLLTIYEYLLFYIVIVPSVKQQIDNALNTGGEAIRRVLQKSTLGLISVIKPTEAYKSTREEIDAIVDAFKTREDQKLAKINNYTIATGVLILLTLGVILYVLKSVLNSSGADIGSCTWITIGVTMILLGFFQYNFYMYGNKFRYIGSAGNEELINFLYQNIEIRLEPDVNVSGSEQSVSGSEPIVLPGVSDNIVLQTIEEQIKDRLKNEIDKYSLTEAVESVVAPVVE